MPRTELIRVTADPKPSILSRAWEIVRSYTVGPLTSRSPELAKYWGGGPSSSGIVVTEHNATAVSAVWAATGLISDDASSLPLFLYRRTKSGGKDKYEDHPLYKLLHDEPNPEMDSMVFRRTLLLHFLIWGNAYAEIERDMVGRPIALWPLIPESVRVDRTPAGDIVYVVSNPSGSTTTIPSADMLHFVGRSHDGSVGGSLVDKAREAIALALATERFGGKFFSNGASLGGVVSYEGPRPPEMSDDNYRAQFEARHRGAENAHKTLFLYNKGRYEQTVIPPNAAQFLETRTHQVREMCRYFKIPPHKLADLADATFSNVEQMNAEYYVSAIRPILVLFEQQFTRKLISKLERRQQFIEHSIEGFLRADSAARSAFYTALFRVGALTRNEIRGYENLDPVEGGDETYLEGNNYVPARLLTEKVEAEIEATKAKTQQSNNPTLPSDPVADAEVKAHLADIKRSLDEQADKLAVEAARAATAETQLTEKAATVDQLTRDVEAARALVDLKDIEIAALDEKREAELAEVVGKTAAQIEELRQQWQDERASILRQRDEAQTAKSDLDVMLGVAEKERDEAHRAAESMREQVRVLEEEASDLKYGPNGLAAVQAQLEAASAISTELRQQLDEQRKSAERLAEARAVAEAERAAAQEECAGWQVHGNEQEHRAMAAESQAKATVDRLGAISLAHRALFVDAIERLLQRETDRARKAQATPEKLRAWVDSFYQLHGETCRSVLRPVVLAWAPCVGMNAETVLNDLVQEHLDTSRRDLRLAADTEDGDELSANLARVLRRWETERADAVADRLLAEGERHGH